MTLHLVQMIEGPELAVNARHVGVLLPGGGLVGTVTLAWTTPVLKPTRVRADLDTLGRTFEFVRVQALDGSAAYVNPLHVAEVAPAVENGQPVVGRSMLVFASPLIVPTAVLGGVTEMARALSANVGPALVKVSL